jgi:hypothetical protein
MSVSLLLPLASAALLLLPFAAEGATGCCTKADPVIEQAGRAEFVVRANQYADLHRVLAAALGPEEMCSDPEQLQRGASDLAAAIREARSAARIGDIFTAGAATFFRDTIAAAARTRYQVPTLLDEMDEEGRPGMMALEVNGAFPWMAGNLMPPMLLQSLPALPEELEYRFVGPALVLLDVRANLIVDVLENALSAGDTSAPHDHAAPAGSPQPDPDGRAPVRPCDVHPEMPACWM